jgi:hypothetical protein
MKVQPPFKKGTNYYWKSQLWFQKCILVGRGWWVGIGRAECYYRPAETKVFQALGRAVWRSRSPFEREKSSFYANREQSKIKPSFDATSNFPTRLACARLESRLIMKSGQKLAALSKSLELAELA